MGELLLVEEGSHFALEFLETAGYGGARLLFLFPLFPVLLYLDDAFGHLFHLLLAIHS